MNENLTSPVDVYCKSNRYTLTGLCSREWGYYSVVKTAFSTTLKHTVNQWRSQKFVMEGVLAPFPFIPSLSFPHPSLLLEVEPVISS